MEVNNINVGETANPFAKSGLPRSPPKQCQQQELEQQQLEHQQSEDELHEQRTREQERRDKSQSEQEQRERQQQHQLQSAWKLPPSQSKVEAAKTVVDELREFVDKRHNVHKDIKDLVARIQGTLGSAVKDWRKVMQRIEAVETELAATKKALAAAVVQPEKTGIAPRKDSKGKERSAGIGTTPSFTPKRHRSSPGDERQAVSKKPKNVNPKPADEVLRGGPGDIPWQEVRNKKKRGKQESARKQRPIRKKAKCEAVVVKTSEDTYAEVLRAMRTDPQLKEFSADVQKIRRTQTGDMLIELKKDSVNKSSTYKELTERVMGEKVQVKAMCPEVTLQLRDLDWITTEEEVRTAIKEQCDLETVQMTVRLRRAPLGTQAASIKLPVDAANKALEVGKIRVGCSVCPLKISQRPEGCYRCLEYGHLARNCEGPDRSKLCRWCGDEGHKAQDCNNKQRCLICKDKSRNRHATGGPKCPAFKQARNSKPQWR